MGARLLVEYDDVPALLRDWQEQLKVGGFFAPIDPPADLPPFAEIELVLAIDDVDPIVARSRVTVANPGAVCFEILPASSAALKNAVERLGPPAAAAEGGGGQRRSVRFVSDSFQVDTRAKGRAKAAAEDPPAATSMAKKIAAMNLAQKVQLAAHGEIDARTFLARERSSGVQLALLKNPKLALEEVMQLARSPALNPEAAEAIARNRTWGSSPQIALMLVRNPRVATSLAIAMVTKLTPSDARMVAKSTDIRLPISAAARKRTMG